MRLDDDGPLDAILAHAAETLKEPVTVRPGMGDRVLAETHRPAWSRASRWLTRPRVVAVSPLAGLALAAGIAALVLLPARRPVMPTTGTSVQFVLRAPKASTVTVVGDFNDWDAHATPLRAAAGASGVWTVEVPLTPGHHEYAFIVDGDRWTADPATPARTTDEFGRPNSVLTVTRS